MQELDELNVNIYSGVFKRAVELFNAADFSNAFIKLHSIIENDKSNYIANYYIAECYFKGLGCSLDYVKAFQNYSIAARMHYDKAIYMVGYCYEMGFGVEKEETQAVSWYMEAIKTDVTEAQYRLGLCYKNGIGIEQSIHLAAACFLKAAQKGKLEAQKEAAICYEQLNQPVAAATLYLAAAEQMDAYACDKIAGFYAQGYGCPKSVELAEYYYKIACDKNNIEAMLHLAQLYKANGSFKEALRLLEKAAKESYEAQMELADCYLNGIGVPMDANLGLRWLKMAAEKNSLAMLKMADYAMNPLPSMVKNEDNAKMWWSKAAALGNSLAMYKLGICYEDGIGCAAPNLNEAYKWYHLASQKGNEDATEACKRFSKSMFGNIKIKKRNHKTMR